MIWRKLQPLLALLLAGCDMHVAQNSAAVDVDMLGWSRSVSLPLESVDSLAAVRFSLFVRYELGRNGGDTLRMRVISRTPHFKYSTDTLALQIPRRGGKLGSGYAIVQLPFGEELASPEKGEYLFSVLPLKEYYHCSAVGVRLERSEEQQSEADLNAVLDNNKK